MKSSMSRKADKHDARRQNAAALRASLRQEDQNRAFGVKRQKRREVKGDEGPARALLDRLRQEAERRRKKKRHVPQGEGSLRVTREVHIFGDGVAVTPNVGDDKHDRRGETHLQARLAEAGPAVRYEIITGRRADRRAEDRRNVQHRRDAGEARARQRPVVFEQAMQPGVFFEPLLQCVRARIDLIEQLLGVQAEKARQEQLRR